EGAPWSVFPTTNPLAGPWSDAYSWADPCQVTSAAAGQPVGRNLTVALTADPGPAVVLGAGSTVNYTFTVTNKDSRSVPDPTVQLSLTTGLTLNSASCDGCTVAGTTVALPPLPGGATQQVSFTAQVAASVPDPTLTVTARLFAPSLTPGALAETAL